KQVLAYHYGLGSEVEAYLVATTLAMAIFVLIRELLEPSFLPPFVGSLSTGNRALAIGLFQLATIALICVAICLSIAASYHAEEWAAFVAPGMKRDAMADAGLMIHWTVPAAGVLGISAL